MREKAPTPFHRPNDSTIEATAGNQTRMNSISVGMPIIKAMTTLSRELSLRTRRPRASGFSAAAGGVEVCGDAVTGFVSRVVKPSRSGGEDRLGLIFQILGHRGGVAVLEELLQGRNDDGTGEVGPAVAIQELRDGLGRGDQFD